MRVSFDSNAWEVVFGSDEAKYASVRSALRSGYMEGFVCEIAFRIEAIKKQSRFDYFWSPRIEVDFPGNVVEIDGNPYVRIASIGPDDQQHPGLPNIQAERWRNARAMGVRLLRGLSWMGLPSPREVVEPVDFVTESIGAGKEREQRQIMVSTKIWNRGVGKQVFDDMGDGKPLNAVNSISRIFQRLVLSGQTASWWLRTSPMAMTFYVRTIAPDRRGNRFSVRTTARGSLRITA